MIWLAQWRGGWPQEAAPWILFAKHFLTVISMKNIITLASTLAKVRSVSYNCEEQTQESILDRILSKGPIIAITAKQKETCIDLSKSVCIHSCLSSLNMFKHRHI